MQKRSRTEYSLLNIITGISGYILNSILGFLCRMVFVKCLSADYLGVNGLFTNIISMLSLTELGVGSAIVFSLYKPLAENDENKIASLMKLYSKAYKAIGLIVTVIGLLLIPFLDIIINEPPNIIENIKILYLINLFNTASSYFFSYKSSLLIASQRNYIVSGVNYITTIIQSVFQIAFLLIFKNYLGYLLIQTIGIFIFNITVSIITDKLFPFINKKDIVVLDKKEKIQLFANIRDLSIYKFSGVLVNSTDNILITFFNGLYTTGIASNYILFVSTLEAILNQIFNSITASIGNHNVTSSTEEQYKMFNFFNLLNFWFYGWGALGIFFCSSDLVLLFFGQEYLLPNKVTFLLALNFFSVGLMNTIRTYKHTLGLFHYGRFIQIFTGILNIVFSIIFGKLYGLFGIFFATFLARILTNFWYDTYAVYKYGFNKSPLLHISKLAFYILLLFIAVLSCNLIFSCITVESGIFKTIIKIFICSIVTNTIFIFGFCKTKEFYMLKELFVNILSKIKSGKKR